ncbi:MAG: hypothetical protein SFU56_04920 [Capsulimonadales bacterium]|nr:hypothetical protein [Capsulimonadales bacterium]
MRKSTIAISLSLLSPALISGCADRKCDERYEDCRSRGGSYVGGVYRSSGSAVHTSGSHSVSGTSRGGFGGFSGFGGFGG